MGVNWFLIGLDSEESLGWINFEEMKNCRIEIIIIIIVMILIIIDIKDNDWDLQSLGH